MSAGGINSTPAYALPRSPHQIKAAAHEKLFKVPDAAMES